MRFKKKAKGEGNIVLTNRTEESMSGSVHRLPNLCNLAPCGTPDHNDMKAADPIATLW